MRASLGVALSAGTCMHIDTFSDRTIITFGEGECQECVAEDVVLLSTLLPSVLNAFPEDVTFADHVAAYMDRVEAKLGGDEKTREVSTIARGIRLGVPAIVLRNYAEFDQFLRVNKIDHAMRRFGHKVEVDLYRYGMPKIMVEGKPMQWGAIRSRLSVRSDSKLNGWIYTEQGLVESKGVGD